MLNSLVILYGLLCGAHGIDIVARTHDQHRHSIIHVHFKSFKQKAIVQKIGDVKPDDEVTFAADAKKGLVYLTMNNLVHSVNISDRKLQNLGQMGFGHDEPPTAMAYDWITDKLYVVLRQYGHESTTTWRIFACEPSNLANCSVIRKQNEDYPARHLVLDPDEGRLYYRGGQLKSLSMDGSSVDNIVPMEKRTNDPSGSALPFAVHLPSRYVYYATMVDTQSEIWRCKMSDERSCRRLVRKSDQVVDMAVTEDLLLWIDTQGKIHGCKLDDCSHTETLALDVSIENFIVVDPALQVFPEKLDSGCTNKNGGCSRFCLLSTKKFSCACAIGIALKNETTCKEQPEKIILMSTPSDIYQLSADTKDLTPKPLGIKEKEIGSSNRELSVSDLQYHYVENMLYFYDTEKFCVRKIGIIEKLAKDVLCFPVKIQQFQLDYINNNIYWIDLSGTKIFITSLYSNQSRLVISEGIKEILSFSLDLEHRRILVSAAADNKTYGEIFVYSLIGERLQQTALEPGYYAGSITMDQKNESILYWSDKNISTISYSSLLEYKHEEIVRVVNGMPFRHLSLLGDFLLAAGGRYMIMKNISDQNGASTIETPVFSVTSLAAIDLTKTIPFSTLDPCSTDNGHCEHICTLSNAGQKVCLCGKGYELESNSSTCVRQKSYALAFFHKNSDIQRIPLERSANGNVMPTGIWQKPSSEVLVAIAVDESTSDVYLASTKDKTAAIYRSIRGDYPAEVLIQGKNLHGIADVAFDEVSKNLYWTNNATGQIIVSAHSGKFRRTITWRNSKPTKIEVIHGSKLIVFVNEESEHNASLRVMPLSGDIEGGKDIVSNLSQVLDIAIDRKNQKIYFAEKIDSKDNPRTRLSTVNFDGSSRQVILLSSKKQMNHISIKGDRLYYADELNGEYGFYYGKQFKILYHGSVIRGMSIYDDSRKSESDSFPCAPGRHSCPELCLGGGTSSSKCYCSDSYTYNKLTGTCQPPEHTIVAASLGQLATMSIERDQKNWTGNPLQVVTSTIKGTPTSIALDMYTGWMFWISDSDAQRNIHYLSIKKSNEINIISTRSPCLNYTSLALDHLGRQLYVSCKTRDNVNHIVVFRITQNSQDPLKYIGIVVDGSVTSKATGKQPRPMAIAVFPQFDNIYYLDGASDLRTAAIIQCKLNGKECVSWYSEPKLWFDTVLHADEENVRLFYTTHGGVSSHSLTSSGSPVRRWYTSTKSSEFLVAPIFEERVLVGETSRDHTKIIEALSGAPFQSGTLDKAVLLHRFSYNPMSYHCEASECSHICRLNTALPEKISCTCLSGFKVDPNNPKSCKKKSPCSSTEFACHNGEGCINVGQLCDGYKHCTDGSDERRAQCVEQRPEMWSCFSGYQQIPRILLCNGQFDCADGSDEEYCSCRNPSSQVDCSSAPNLHPSNNPSQCIPRSQLCDGYRNCDNGFDESHMVFGCSSEGLRKNSSNDPNMALTWIIVGGFAIIVMIVVCCYFRSRRPKSPRHEPRFVPLSQCETMRMSQPTRSLYSESSTYQPPLPPPNSSIVSRTYGSDIMHVYGPPPPSAVSGSISGIPLPHINQPLIPRQVRSIETSSDDEARTPMRTRRSRNPRRVVPSDRESGVLLPPRRLIEKLKSSMDPRIFANSEGIDLDDVRSSTPVEEEGHARPSIQLSPIYHTSGSIRTRTSDQMEMVAIRPKKSTRGANHSDYG